MTLANVLPVIRFFIIGFGVIKHAVLPAVRARGVTP